MTIRFQKTDAGRDEIRARRLDLPRPARTLLLIIDASKTGEEWVSMITGVVPGDLERLVAAGLVVPVALPAAPAVPAVPPPGAAPPAPSLEAAGFRSLYDFLTAQARPRLGLIKGYRAVLDIERCTDVAELRRHALRFIEQVREVQGEAAAREVARDLDALR
jgi:hypothetical protein